MTQTLAIFAEAYRNLNARKLFWISVVISILIVAAFALVGVNDRGLAIFGWTLESPVLDAANIPPEIFYKWIFVEVGIGWWLSWIAAILALISTAGMFPDLITAGAVDLYVSRPISRLRLFFTEYVAGLLFVTFQVTLFSLASFLVIGLRGGAWEPSVFVAVPLVVCFFSYLFAVCVLLGVLTRSTVAALLLALLFWAGVSMVGAAEQGLLMQIKFAEHKVDLSRMMVMSAEGAATESTSRPDEPAPDEPEAVGKASTGMLRAHQVFYGIKTVLPKTADTIELLERTLIRLADLPDDSLMDDGQIEAATRDFAEELRGRSVAWVVGTSLALEAVVLALAAFIFCRRDF